MKRLLNKQLIAWKHNPRRKPLLLMGARQVGKTHTLKAFAADEYKQLAYFNFEDEPHLRELFEDSLDPHKLIKVLAVEAGIKITAADTLIFFDEIQACPKALNSLKYFCENAPEYSVCAAGSLLGVKLSHTAGFPVGKVDFLDLYPLNFTEYLMALDEQQLLDYLGDNQQTEPLPKILLVKLTDHFKDYLFIGGMPEAVVNYLETRDVKQVRSVQKAILDAYQLDFAKHAPPNVLMQINQVWNAIPSQLGKENRKFIYSVIRKGARAKDFEGALQWLSEASLIHKVYNISTPKLPLEAYADFEYFKIYLLDVGLLGAMANLPAKAILQMHDDLQEFKGALIENYVATVLKQRHKNLYYWTSQNRAELDFVFQFDTQIYPLEVKSGTSNKKKSLQTYRQKYNPALSVRTSMLNLKQDDGLLNCPLFLLDQLACYLN